MALTALMALTAQVPSREDRTEKQEEEKMGKCTICDHEARASPHPAVGDRRGA